MVITSDRAAHGWRCGQPKMVDTGHAEPRMVEIGRGGGSQRPKSARMSFRGLGSSRYGNG